MASPSQLFAESQPAFAFPQSLTDKYQPATFAEFAGLSKPKANTWAEAVNKLNARKGI